MKLDATLKMFSVVFGVIYLACFLYGIAPIRYYPMVGQFVLSPLPESSGPPILWYGWLSAAAVTSIAIAVIIPSRWAERVWHGWLWIIPALSVVAIFIYERRWFQ